MSKRRRKGNDEETTYWLSYSDMMAALLLVFVLIISFTILQSKKQFEAKENELLEKQKIVEEQTLLLEEQKAMLMEQSKTMEEQQKKIDEIIGVRKDLIGALKDEFDGTDLKVSVDPQTGSITFDSSILFDTGKYNLKTGGEDFLKEFVPIYIGVLLKPEYRDYISEIIIEGHTDTESGYIYNLGLSQERALSVATYILKDNSSVLSKEQLNELRTIITANGRSYSAPVFKEDGSVDMDASRRVEFKFRLKDEDMINEMNETLSNK